MIKLNTDQVLYLYNMMHKATGGSAGLRDIGVLKAALSHAYATFEGSDLYPTIEAKAARQAYGIIRNHPFVNLSF